MREQLEKRIWWDYIHEDLQELLLEAVELIDKVSKWKERYHDYAFIVFPASKAYEGFLKTIFHDLGFISDEDFYGKRFRIGRALNPSLESNLRERESVYDRLVTYCQGKELANDLWDTWKMARNLVFHWFPNEKNAITFPEAEEKVNLVLNAMDKAFKECKIKTNA